MHITSYRSSEAVNYIATDLMRGTVHVQFTNGLWYGYTNVSRRAIANLRLQPNMSLGFWVNQNLIEPKRVKCINSNKSIRFWLQYMQEFNPNYYLRSQLEYAEEQLMIADDISSKILWGNRCDALEAAIADLSE